MLMQYNICYGVGMLRLREAPIVVMDHWAPSGEPLFVKYYYKIVVTRLIDSPNTILLLLVSHPAFLTQPSLAAAQSRAPDT